MVMPFMAAGVGFMLMTMTFRRRTGFERLFGVYAFAAGVTLLVSWIPLFLWLCEPWKWLLTGIGLVKGCGLDSVWRLPLRERWNAEIWPPARIPPVFSAPSLPRSLSREWRNRSHPLLRYRSVRRRCAGNPRVQCLLGRMCPPNPSRNKMKYRSGLAILLCFLPYFPFDGIEADIERLELS